MDSALALIKALISTLKANPSVAALGLDDIYTDTPQKAVFPYVVLSMESAPFASASFSGQSHQVRIQCFSRQASAKECLTIRKACMEALDRKESSITLSEGTLIQAQMSDFSTFFQEDDGRTWQAVGEMRFDIQ